MWRILPLAIALAACQPQIPDNGPQGRVARGEGVGFGNYRDYQAAQAQARAQRNAALLGASADAAPPPGGEPAPGTPGAAGLNPTIAAAVEAVQPGAPARPAAAAVPSAPPATPPAVPAQPFTTPGPVAVGPATPGTPVIVPGPRGISDEQSFDAVAERESIQSDAERMAQNRAAFEVVQPTALPARPESTGPNLAQFALSTTNAVGQPIYRRGGVFSASRQERNCARYSSADRAQAAFLAAGGPDRDREGLDPDGDGFACGWSPAPYRAAVGR
ncbi:hypothetical protein BCF33_0143 [Hasllibacter halocynthiae]|uniref:Excalibur calcium-binding domain-containing protein n=1 Tax=Hasllibacter halocynthiae TaxID=595589 RepID=A0A2T0X6H2_9RHOB|nr:hypothetical protein [Hasllibacter halocynthiae]PRY94552.1 hypothetical protein BCF33_0143 [Hasllibacter halocynthiae]